MPYPGAHAATSNLAEIWMEFYELEIYSHVVIINLK